MGRDVHPQSAVSHHQSSTRGCQGLMAIASYFRPGKKWRHEQGSEMMLDFMISEYGIPIPKKDQQFIKALIAGDPSKSRSVIRRTWEMMTQCPHLFFPCSPDEKKFLFDIVANKRNGLDVDK